MSLSRVLLVISGSVAAYKSLELIRLLRERGVTVIGVLTQGGQQFITPLSVASLSGQPVYTDLFSLKDEAEMGHIRLSREADMILVAPASADLLAKMASGLADDLATSILLATDTPVIAVPAMNPHMWRHPATQRNIVQLRQDGIRFIGPESGDMACGEQGLGRMTEPEAIVRILFAKEEGGSAPLTGFSALVTSGPTWEAIDPVRFIGNRSSGKQGAAIAEALAKAGADVTLITGPVHQQPPEGVYAITVESAEEMLDACEDTLPVDIAVCAAAVADWRPSHIADQKIKKQEGAAPPAMELKESPDILATLSQHKTHRPLLVVGFAAETENLIDNAKAKRLRKGCDWILANDVSDGMAFGRDENTVSLITADGVDAWSVMSKRDIAHRLVKHIVKHLI